MKCLSETQKVRQDLTRLIKFVDQIRILLKARGEPAIILEKTASELQRVYPKEKMPLDQLRKLIESLEARRLELFSKYITYISEISFPSEEHLKHELDGIFRMIEKQWKEILTDKPKYIASQKRIEDLRSAYVNIYIKEHEEIVEKRSYFLLQFELLKLLSTINKSLHPKLLGVEKEINEFSECNIRADKLSSILTVRPTCYCDYSLQ